MNEFDPALDVDPAVARACSRFLAQVRGVVSIEGMAVVLLDQDQATSRVVFFWETPDKPNRFRETTGNPSVGGAAVDLPSTYLPLNGRDGPLGAVLIRGMSASNLGPVEPDLVRKPAEHLAALLENILLQHRLDRNALERMVLDRIGDLVGGDVPVEQVYELFAIEVKNLVEYQRLTVFISNQEAELLSCVYTVGPGMPPVFSEMTHQMSGSGLELVVSTRESLIIEDLQGGNEPGLPDFPGYAGLRSAVIVPVLYGGDVVGVVALEHRLPKAYGPTPETLLLRAVALLGPVMRNTADYHRLPESGLEAAATTEIARILASSPLMEDVFDCFASATSELVKCDCVTLAWLDPSGCDILSLQAFPGIAPSGEMPENELSVSIQTRLRFGEDHIGTLGMWRSSRNGVPFTDRDQEALDRLGVPVFFAVQYDRLHRLSRHQAHQLGQLNRVSRSVGQVSDFGEVSQDLVDQAAQKLDVQFAALYFCRDGHIVIGPVASDSEDPGARLDPLAPDLVMIVENCMRTGQLEVIEQSPAVGTPIASDVSKACSTASLLGVPLSCSIGPAGVLVLGREGACPWLSADVDLAQLVADEIGELMRASEAVDASSEPEGHQWSDSLRQELLINAAHAFRTPLSSIKGYSSTLLQSDVTWPPELHQEFIETIDREADHLSRAINDLLGSMESESSTIHLIRSVFSVECLFETAENELAADSSCRPVVFQCEPDLPPVLVDPIRIVKVIVYLARCTDRIAASGSHLRVRAFMEDSRPRIVVSASQASVQNNEGQAVAHRPSHNTSLLLGWVDQDLMLSVCNSLLSSHGVDLQIGATGAGEELFRFELPRTSPLQQGAVLGP